MTASTERPTPETDAFYMNRACVVEAEAMLEEWARGAEHARRLERQRDALKEALRDACPSPGVDPQAWWERARAAIAALERGEGKEEE